MAREGNVVALGILDFYVKTLGLKVQCFRHRNFERVPGQVMRDWAYFAISDYYAVHPFLLTVPVYEQAIALAKVPPEWCIT